MQHVRLTDQVIWFKHVEGSTLLERLKSLPPGEEINLEVNGVVGRWKRMSIGSDGRPTDGIKPSGSMRAIWSEWYSMRRGDRLPVREVLDETGRGLSLKSLFPEWSSAEDEAAFRDL
ncbi:hypothetical protein [Rhizobium sp. SSA_523]|uniref:hypothetical protein n=1 Tax=Rhizobium sp. SSA_523 TaxID=2952477 RepID=UPI002091DEA9|nr:hypothetical protein [Rhizobium sp. SSA_523]MCO5730421.1 hypothetical protein [Rhizobium sp. SSA_523]WKC25464.1 hypothetical protein QTJ18_16000 [Rhizobium sp. SSA_523]